MSYPNDAPAAAWYPDPQTPGQVRWWDGTNWTEHVSTPAVPQTAEVAPATPTVAEQLAAAPTAQVLPQIDEADAALADADATFATVTYIGRHAAGATPAPRLPSSAPRFRPRDRVEVPVEARVEVLQYA